MGPAAAGRTVAGREFENHYLAHYLPLARLAGLLLSDAQAGEEVAQEAFARLLDTRRPIGDPGAYLRATTLNLSRSRLRRVRVARRHPALPEATVAGPEDTTGSLAAHRPLRQALGELPTRQREAIVLRFYAEMTEAEVARAMGISVGSVKTHLHRALARLANLLEDLR